MKAMRILVGIGKLDWNRQEEITERYGTVNISMLYPTKLQELEGKTGKLEAVVRQAVNKPPRKPSPSGFFHLGYGKLFRESIAGDSQIGVAPVPIRDNHWLDCESLDSLRGHIVELWFTPANNGTG